MSCFSYEVRRRKNWKGFDTFYEAWKRRNAHKNPATSDSENELFDFERRLDTDDEEDDSDDDDVVKTGKRKRKVVTSEDEDDNGDVKECEDDKKKIKLFQPTFVEEDIISITDDDDEDRKPSVDELFKQKKDVKDIILISDSENE